MTTMLRAIQHAARSASVQVSFVGCASRNLSHSAQMCQAPASQVPSALWKLGRLNHVAIATPNLEASTALYR